MMLFLKLFLIALGVGFGQVLCMAICHTIHLIIKEKRDVQLQKYFKKRKEEAEERQKQFERYKSGEQMEGFEDMWWEERLKVVQQIIGYEVVRKAKWKQIFNKKKFKEFKQQITEQKIREYFMDDPIMVCSIMNYCNYDIHQFSKDFRREVEKGMNQQLINNGHKPLDKDEVFQNLKL